MRTIKLIALLSLVFATTILGQNSSPTEITANNKEVALQLPKINVVPIKDPGTAKNYELYIKLPEDYAEHPDKSYPVLYYTDAMWHLEMLSGSTEYMLEDIILVGISWQKGISEDLMQKYGAHASRFTDYSFWTKTNPNHPLLKFGDAQKHLTFIRNNVIQYIDNNYRTDPNSRSYFGYSLSGAFGAYILLSQPDTFDNYILGSPLSRGLVKYLVDINKTIGAFDTDKNNTVNANVFIAYGSLEEDNDEPIEEYLALLNPREHSGLAIQNKVFEGDHGTAFPRVALESVAWLQSLTNHVASDTYEDSFWDTPLLNNAFVTTTPEDRGDGILVDTLSVPSQAQNAMLNLSQEIYDGKHGSYDALLVSHKNKLVFESYYRKGRINVAHGQASAVKGHTSLILGRAIQMGYLTLEDLDKPLISFLKDVNPNTLVEGAQKLTLHKALTMHGGLTIDREEWQEIEKDSASIKGQRLVQTLLEQSAPITDETQKFLYGNFNPIMVMAVIDAVVPGAAQDFIKTEVLGKLGITNYKWQDHASGLPQAGWQASLTSRDMLKLGHLVLNNGKLDGEQLISAAYLAKATSGLVQPDIDWMPKEYHYGYFWYQTQVPVGNRSYNASWAWGGGGQYVIVVDELDLTLVINGHDRDDEILATIFEVVVPAFIGNNQ